MRNIITILILILLTCSGAAVAYDDFFVVAHEDDDLLFMNPDIQNSINMKNKVRIVYVTAGDAGQGEAYWTSRERGMLNAYSFMASMKTCKGPDDSAACQSMLNQWGWSNPRSPAPDGKEYIIYWAFPPQGGTIELIFLRLPDGELMNPTTVPPRPH